MYAVCRCTGLPRTLAEIAEYSPHDESTIRGASRVLNAELDLSARPPRPQAYVPRLTFEVGVSAQIPRSAAKLADHAWEDGHLANCNPAGIAAACLFVVAQDAGLDVWQKTLADLAGVST